MYSTIVYRYVGLYSFTSFFAFKQVHEVLKNIGAKLLKGIVNMYYYIVFLELHMYYYIVLSVAKHRI
jgi:hypothetical protein